MRTNFLYARRRQLACFGLAWFGASLVGCSGTSTQFGNPAPPLNAPGLKSRGTSARNAGGGTSATKAAEAALPSLEAVATPKGTFTDAPYLQLGEAASAGAGKESLTVCWQSSGGAKNNWSLETRPASGGTWQKTAAPVTARALTLPGETPQSLYRAPLTDLAPGSLFDYRVLQGGKAVFSARGRARRAATEPHRLVVFGDCAEGGDDQKKIAYQASLAKPDYVFITGDIVYDRGRASEYQKNYFPVYNAEKASPDTGAPLLRSTLFLACPGNHDLAYNDLSKWPDGLAYFYYWDVPRNGPLLGDGDSNTAKTTGNDAAARALRTAAGDAYPRTANYAFDYGGVHWTVLDANSYMNWNDKTLRAWLEKDLAGAQKANWRFVAFHEPPFHSSKEHQSEQWMRSICDLLEKYKVDIVWSGHVHNYQRTYPLMFARTGDREKSNEVDGKWTLDKTFDGEKQTKANAPIYVVTGGGGAPLYSTGLAAKPEEWQPFTAKYVGEHSFTVVDVDTAKVTVRQVSANGKDVDRFTLTR